MPIIQGYDDHIAAQGGIGVRATADDFGGQIGQGMQRLGAGLQDAADATFKIAETKDVTAQHVNFAEATPEWDKALVTRANEAQPGTDDFVTKLQSDMKDWVAKGENSAATPAGRKLYASLAANMVSQFTQRAIGIQGELDAKEATVQNIKLNNSLETAAYGDPSRAQDLIAQGKAAIADPKSIYGRIPQPARDAYAQKLEQQISYAAMRGLVRDNPFMFLDQADPGQLEQFKPFDKLLRINAVAGGKVSITPETMAQAPSITAAAAVKNVNPNIAMAQADVAGPNAESPKDQTQAMGTLLNKFGGDYTMALGAYHMGTLKLGDLTAQYGTNWASYLPTDTKDYIGTVMTKAGMVPVETPAPTAQDAPPEEPAPTGKVDIPTIPLLKNLSSEQQDHLFGEAVRLAHLKLGMAEKARSEQEYQEKKVQETRMKELDGQIFNPSKFGKFDVQAVAEDTTLTSAQIQHMIGTYERRQRELRADHESKQHPEEVRRLDGMIHAAADDPTKTFSFKPIQDSYMAGSISFQERNALMGVFEQSKDGDSAGFGRRMKVLQDTAYAGFTRSLEGSVQPEVAVNAYYTWWNDLQTKVADKRAKGEDPSVLIDPSSREFLGGKDRLSSFMHNGAPALAPAVDKQKAQLPKGRDNAKPGEAYLDDKGNVRQRSK